MNREIPISLSRRNIKYDVVDNSLFLEEGLWGHDDQDRRSKVAAFFDFDKTLLDGDSQVMESLSFLFKPCIWPNMFLPFRIFRAAVYNLLSNHSTKRSYDQFDETHEQTKNNMALSIYSNFPTSVLEKHATILYEKVMKPRLFPEMLQRIENHRKQGHLVFLISASTDHLLEPFCQDVFFNDWRATSLQKESKVRYKDTTCHTTITTTTGKADGQIMFGKNKVIFAQHVANDWDFDLEHSFFYSDHHSDLPLFNAVGYPMVVNPTKQLETISKEKKWPILRLRRSQKQEAQQMNTVRVSPFWHSRCKYLLVFGIIVMTLFCVPSELWGVHHFSIGFLWVRSVLKNIMIVWSCCAQMDISRMVGLLTFTTCIYFLSTKKVRSELQYKQEKKSKCPLTAIMLERVASRMKKGRLSFYLSSASVLYAIIFISTVIGLIVPSILWSPAAWFNYKLYHPFDIEKALDGSYFGSIDHAKSSHLRLSESSWEILSSGSLSSNNEEDIHAVIKGISYAKDISGGLIVNVMGRDVVHHINALRNNIEGLVPFFEKKLVVVVFENDSVDGTRSAFKKWSSEVEDSSDAKYRVDLMECPEVPDCIMRTTRRYNNAGDEYSSVVEKMADYRNRVLDYVQTNPAYNNFSHMLVLDMDLDISISPLGLIHSLGTDPEHPIASSGRRLFQGSFGTLTPPYDFSAFRAHGDTAWKKFLLHLHEHYCNLMPKGHRWHNLCDDVSPFQHMLITEADAYDKSSRHDDSLYQVDSAYNGAALYPLDAIQKSRYDSGIDGQRCEHVGFHLSTEKPMFVNRLWNMHLDPKHPAGPSGNDIIPDIFLVVLNFKLLLALIIPPFLSICLAVYFSQIFARFVVHILLVVAFRNLTMGYQAITTFRRPKNSLSA